MTDTTVAYHVEDGIARPAIDVKCPAAGITFWPPTFGNLVDDVDRHVAAAYDRVQSDFWQAAQEIATQRGLGEITRQGRSGGWLVFTDGRDPQDAETFGYSEDGEPGDEPWTRQEDNARREWLAAYRAMVEWADAYIAAAPRRVRDLAQSMAMDAAGSRTVTIRAWLAFGKEYAL